MLGFLLVFLACFGPGRAKEGERLCVSEQKRPGFTSTCEVSQLFLLALPPVCVLNVLFVVLCVVFVVLCFVCELFCVACCVLCILCE